MGRSLLALLAGFIAEPLLVIAADWIYGRIQPGVISPEGYVYGIAAVIVLIYVQIINAVCGYITGRIAPKNPVGHALILGIIGFALCVFVSARHWHMEPHWYLLGGVVFAIPSTTLGGYLARRQPVNRPALT